MIYRLDKVVAITIHIPPYPPEDWITTPTFVNVSETHPAVSWTSDVSGAVDVTIYDSDLAYYTHMCRIRRIHSRILSIIPTLSAEARAAFIQDVRAEIDQWAQDDQIYAYW